MIITKNGGNFECYKIIEKLKEENCFIFTASVEDIFNDCQTKNREKNEKQNTKQNTKKKRKRREIKPPSSSSEDENVDMKTPRKRIENHPSKSDIVLIDEFMKL